MSTVASLGEGHRTKGKGTLAGGPAGAMHAPGRRKTYFERRRFFSSSSSYPTAAMANRIAPIAKSGDGLEDTVVGSGAVSVAGPVGSGRDGVVGGTDADGDAATGEAVGVGVSLGLWLGLGEVDGSTLGLGEGEVDEVGEGVVDGVVEGDEEGSDDGPPDGLQWSSLTPPCWPCWSQSAPFDGCGSGLQDWSELPWSHSPCPGGLDGWSARAEALPLRAMAPTARRTMTKRFMRCPFAAELFMWNSVSRLVNITQPPLSQIEMRQRCLQRLLNFAVE